MAMRWGILWKICNNIRKCLYLVEKQKNKLYIHQDYKKYLNGGKNSCEKIYSKIFTIVWDTGARDNFFSAFLCGFCYYMRKRKHYFKICTCVLGRKTISCKRNGRSSLHSNTLLQITVTWAVTGSLLHPSFEGQCSLHLQQKKFSFLI